MRYAFATVLFFLGINSAGADSWVLIVDPAVAGDAAVQLAVQDFATACADAGEVLKIVSDAEGEDAPQRILLGAIERNKAIALAVADGAIHLDEVEHPQGFQIRTSSDGQTIVVAGKELIGDVYGLYWLRDRMRVARAMPMLNTRREPALAIRFGHGEDKGALEDALRCTANWAWGTSINDLVPWVGVDNAASRDETEALIAHAHALHMKYFAFCDEISYHPSLMTAVGATLSPDDPALWTMLQEKYRMLLRAMPSLDGVRIRTGEHTRVFEPCLPYDVMHEPLLEDWPLERRYRTFVQKLHEVVVGEFGKLYYHRTWIPDPTEQHSRADVYKAIFNDAVPTANLYLSPYLTASDRWFYQPFNPTFNQTDHAMVVLLAAMDYHAHAGVPVAPVYPGEYFCEGMKRIATPAGSNVVGVDMGTTDRPAWTTAFVTNYLAFRLAWDPLERPEDVARDIAAMVYGPDAAETVARILMLSAEAYRDGLYIKPVAGKLKGNTLPQLRLTTFPVRGIPEIDGGKAHIEWARRAIYEPSLNALDEAVAALDHGLRVAQQMEDLGRAAALHIEDADAARHLQETLQLTHLLIETNNRYVKTIYAYCRYADDPRDQNRQALATGVDALRATADAFRGAPGFCYKLFGVEQMTRNAQAALDDLQRAQQLLQDAPDADAVFARVRAYQQTNDEVFAKHRERAVKLLSWSGMIDGKDIVRVRGSDVELEHIEADAPHNTAEELVHPLPQRPVTVLIDTLESREWNPVVLEQPSEANDWTVAVLLFDPATGYGVRKFDLYYIEEPPEAAGLASIAAH